MTGWPQWDDEAARALIAAPSKLRGGLLEALHLLQAHFGCVDQRAIDLAADVFNLSRAEVFGVVGFYDDLRSKPRISPVLHLCMGEACQAVGAGGLKEQAGAAGVEVEEIFCLGNCACGPSVMLNNEVFGRVTPEKIKALAALVEGESP